MDTLSLGFPNAENNQDQPPASNSRENTVGPSFPSITDFHWTKTEWKSATGNNVDV